MRLMLLAAVICILGCGHDSARAAALSVAPVTVSVLAPESAAVLTISNRGTKPVAVQIRAFAWSQTDGRDRLTPTRALVVSPPIVTIPPGKDQVVRVVRLAGGAVMGEESYRLLVDQLPNPRDRQNGVVNVLLRYSIPVFFTAQDASEPRLSWRLISGSPVRLSVRNTGQRHFRIADLGLQEASGKLVVLRKGLVGYVLGGSSMSWSFGHVVQAFSRNEAKIVGDSQEGPFKAAIGEAR
jgi:fimbrial chaperone protein